MTSAIRQVSTPAGDPAWLVTGYQTVRELLADHRLGRSHPEPEKASRFSEAVIVGQPSGDPATEKQEHAAMRRLLTPAFSAKRMRALRPEVERLVDDLLDELARQEQPADLHELLAFPLPALVICELLGVPYDDRDDFRRWSDDLGHMTDGERSQAGREHLDSYMRELIERKRQQPSEDVISDLVRAQAEFSDAITETRMIQLAGSLLFAGHETTVTAIDRGVVLLLTHPDQLELMRQDSTLIRKAVEETLRHPNPVAPSAVESGTGLPRYATADIDVSGTTIRTGDMVLLELQGANLEHEIFPDPTSFDIRREANPHLSFGHGPHFCIGAPLARVELQVVFEKLFSRFPELRLGVPTSELRSRGELLTGGLAALPVSW